MKVYSILLVLLLKVAQPAAGEQPGKIRKVQRDLTDLSDGDEQKAPEEEEYRRRQFLHMTEKQWAYGRLNADRAIPLFIDLFRNEFWDIFIDAIDAKTSGDGSSPFWETSGFWFSASVSLGGFHMNRFGEGDISVIAKHNPNALQVEIVINNIFAQLQSVRFDYSTLINSCEGATLKVTASIPSLVLEVALSPGASGENISAQILNLDFPNSFSITVEPALGNQNCKLEANAISTMASSVAAAVAPFVSFLENEMLDWADKNSFSFKIGETRSFNISEGATFNFDPLVGLLESSAPPLETRELHAQLGGQFSASLSYPEWRAGSSHFSLVTDNIISIPDDPLVEMAEGNMYQNGIDSIVDTIWYLKWSEWADNELAADSDLCEPTDLDPCPFPPIIDDIPRGSAISRLLRVAWFVRSIGSNFRTAIQVPRIDIDILEKGALQAAGEGTIQVFAVNRHDASRVSLMASLSVSFEIVGIIPTFNEELQIFENMSIQSVKHSTPKFADQGRVRYFLRRAATRAAIWTAAKVVNRLSDKVDKKINSILAGTPLPLSNITDVPLPKEALEVLLRGVTRLTHRADVDKGQESRIELDGSVEVLVDRENAVRGGVDEPCEERDWECEGDLKCGRTGHDTENSVCCAEVIYEYDVFPKKPKICKDYANLIPRGSGCSLDNGGVDCYTGVCALNSGASYKSPVCCDERWVGPFGLPYCQEWIPVGGVCSDVLGLDYDEVCAGSVCAWRDGGRLANRACCTETFSAGPTGFFLEYCKEALGIGAFCSDTLRTGYDELCAGSYCAYTNGLRDSWQYCCPEVFENPVTKTQYCKNVVPLGQRCGDESTLPVYLNDLCIGSTCAFEGLVGVYKKCCTSASYKVLFARWVCD